MKKIICLLLVILCITSFTACGDKYDVNEFGEYDALGEDSENIYYSLGDAVYVINKATGAAKQIRKVEDSSVYAIAATEDALYLADGDFSETAVFKMNKDGTGDTELFGSEDLPESNRYTFSEMFVAEDKLFIKASTVVFTYDLTDGDIEKISSDIDVFRVADGKIYFTKEKSKTFTVYSMPVNGGEETVVAGYGKVQPDDKRYTNFEIVGDTLVLLDDETVAYAMPLAGGEAKKISDVADLDDAFIASYKGKVYFSSVDKDFAGKIYEYNPKNGKVKKIFEPEDFNPMSDIRIIDGNLMYYTSSNGPMSVKIK